MTARGQITTAGDILAGGRSVLEGIVAERREIAAAKERGREQAPSELGRAVAALAAVMRGYLVRLSADNATAWAVTVLETRPPRATSEPHEFDGDGKPLDPSAWAPHYTHREAERACQAYARELRRDDWPVLSEILASLRASRVEAIRRADQDLTRAALPAAAGITDEEAARKAALARVWRSVTEDVLGGLLVGEGAAELEARRRLEMGDEAVTERRRELRAMRGRTPAMVTKGGA